jgi:acetyl esterase/lipase
MQAPEPPGEGGPLAHIAQILRELGPRYADDIARHSQFVKELYAPLLLAQPRGGIAVTRGLAYGTHQRQVLDVFRPEGAREADVAVFVHGGAFVRGSRSAPEGVYDNVLTWFARQGFVGVNLEYRLAPEALYPEGARDVAAALQWIEAHAGAFGGDPRRILLIGHSAGGTHAVTYACDPVMADTRCSARGLVLVSARLRADADARNPNAAAVASYFGADASQYVDRSPVTHAHRCRAPVLVAIAQYENPLLDVYGLEFAHRLAQARGHAPRFVQCSGHNHMSLMAHFDSGDDILGREILAFWRSLDA